MSPHALAVLDEGLRGEGLGESIRRHICCGTVNESNNPTLDLFTKRVYSNVDVLRAFTVNGVLGHQSARAIVFVEGGGRGLRSASIS